MDRFVVIHKPCKVRVVLGNQKREGYHYQPIGPEGLGLWLEMDFELRGEAGGSEEHDQGPWSPVVATD